MMSFDFFFRDKISVAVLGAMGKMGQRLVQQLAHHPWFEIVALCDESPSLIGKPYGELISKQALPEIIQNIHLQPCEAPFLCSIIFSLLHAPGVYVREKLLAQAGYFVISSAAYKVSNHIPLIVAEVNHDQLALLQQQESRGGGIVAHPHSVASGLALALKPLIEKFGLDVVQVTVPQLWNQEEVKNRSEGKPALNEEVHNEIGQQLLLILGQLEGSHVQKASFKISVQDDHRKEREQEKIFVSVKLKKQAQADELIQAWRSFRSESQRLPLPTAPFHPLYYLSDPHSVPSDKEMPVYIEQLVSGSTLDYTFTLFFSHIMRGIVGSMLLNAELLVARGNIYW